MLAPILVVLAFGILIGCTLPYVVCDISRRIPVQSARYVFRSTPTGATLIDWDQIQAGQKVILIDVVRGKLLSICIATVKDPPHDGGPGGFPSQFTAEASDFVNYDFFLRDKQPLTDQ